MIKKPVYTFSTSLSTGYDKVPVNSLIHIEDGDGDGNPYTLTLTAKTGITSSTTWQDIALVPDNWISDQPMHLNISTTSTLFHNLHASTDTSGGVITLTLPPSPLIQTVISIHDATGSFELNNVTVARNGETIMNLAEDMLLDVNYKEYKFRYTGTTWLVSQ